MSATHTGLTDATKTKSNTLCMVCGVSTLKKLSNNSQTLSDNQQQV